MVVGRLGLPVPVVVYLQWCAGSATVEALADADAVAVAFGFAAFGFAGEEPPVNAKVRPRARPRTKTTADPMVSRWRSFCCLWRRSSRCRSWRSRARWR